MNVHTSSSLDRFTDPGRSLSRPPLHKSYTETGETLQSHGRTVRSEHYGHGVFQGTH